MRRVAHRAAVLAGPLVVEEVGIPVTTLGTPSGPTIVDLIPVVVPIITAGGTISRIVVMAVVVTFEQPLQEPTTWPLAIPGPVAIEQVEKRIEHVRTPFLVRPVVSCEAHTKKPRPHPIG